MKLNLKNLIKECVLEVLEENLIEGFDPLSQGPNEVETNPYERWNSEMRKLEETDEDESSPKTFQEIRNEQDPNGINHDLTLVCVKCGDTDTCRCSKPKRKFKGICKDCSESMGRYAQEAGAGEFDDRTTQNGLF